MWLQRGGRTMDSGKIRYQIRARHQELGQLEARAGIGVPADQLRRASLRFEHVYFAHETDPGPKQALIDFERRLHEEKTNRRTRDLYSCVRDTGLRRALIEKEREIANLSLRFWCEELNEAADRLRETETAGRNWWVPPSILGIFFIGGSYYFVGQPGALIGLLLLVVWVLQARKSHHQALPRREAIEQANRESKDAEKTWLEAKNEPLLFSEREALTGEPDQARGGYPKYPLLSHSLL